MFFHLPPRQTTLAAALSRHPCLVGEGQGRHGLWHRKDGAVRLAYGRRMGAVPRRWRRDRSRCGSMTEGGGYDAARRQISSWREKGEELHGSSAGEGVGGGGTAFFSCLDVASRGTGGTTLVFSSRASPADAQGVAERSQGTSQSELEGRQKELEGWPPSAFCFVAPGPLAFLPLRHKGGREVWANAAQYEGRGLRIGRSNTQVKPIPHGIGLQLRCPIPLTSKCWYLCLKILIPSSRDQCQHPNAA
jgi:hypothetical protein